MLPLERRNWLEKQVILNKKISIEEASINLNVSPMTIRRDLKELEGEGKVVRTYGGAYVPDLLTVEMPYYSKESENKLQKKAIAAKAVSLIEKNSTIILDSGTTTLELAKLLKVREDLTVVTNDIIIAYELFSSPLNVIVTGGELQREVGALYGTETQKMLKNIHADIFFLGAHAFDMEYGVTAPTFEKALIKQMMIEAAEKTWLLADFSKANKIAFSNVCSLNELDGIITDAQTDTSLENKYGSVIPILRTR